MLMEAVFFVAKKCQMMRQFIMNCNCNLKEHSTNHHLMQTGFWKPNNFEKPTYWKPIYWKKCLKVRQALGTLQLWKFDNLKTWKLEYVDNIKNDLWDMLNNFCFHLYAQNSLFICENCNAFFWTSAAASVSPSPVSLGVPS